MANLQNMLNAAKRQKSNPGGTQAQTQQQQSVQNRMVESITSTDTNLLDEMVFGAPTDEDTTLYEHYPNGKVREVYDPNKEMEELKSGKVSYQASNSHLPQAILESIMQNPLDVPADGIDMGDQVMTENLKDRTLDIIDKLDNRDKKKHAQQQPQAMNEQLTAQPTAPTQQAQPVGYSFNLNELAGLIEAVVDKKFRQYGAGLLTEGRDGGQAPRAAIMTLGDSLKFMDSSGNVYECTMKYVGKGKVRNK